MRKKRILLVEDTADDVELMLLALDKQALVADIDVMRNGAEAMSYLTDQDSPPGSYPRRLPDLVFLDLNMPLVDGFEVLKQIRANAGIFWLPVVILTSSLQPEDIKRAYALGANSYIHKPVDFKQFSYDLERIADYWLNLNVHPHQLPIKQHN